MIQIGFRGQRFDPPNVPLYVEMQEGVVVNTFTHQTIALASLQAAMAAEGYLPLPGEILPSADTNWADNNSGWWTSDGAPEQPTTPPDQPIIPRFRNSAE